MDDEEFQKSYDELKQCLAQMIDLLRETGEDRWVRWFERAQAGLLAFDRYSFGAILSAYGGMGSFNDLILDEPLRTLRSRCWRLAHDMSHGLSRQQNDR
jgi:hypothetical protein